MKKPKTKSKSKLVSKSKPVASKKKKSAPKRQIPLRDQVKPRFKKESKKQQLKRLRKLYPGRYPPQPLKRGRLEPKRRIVWPPEKYAFIVKGGTTKDEYGKPFHVEGLRTLARGFDDYDLRHPERWTSAQKRRVREFFKRVTQLQGQDKRVVRAKGENLKYLHHLFHGKVPSKDFKVAWVPDIEPALTVREGLKKAPPKIDVIKRKGKPVGVRVERAQFRRTFIEFDKVALVKNVAAEVKDKASYFPKATLFYIQVDENTSLAHVTSLDRLIETVAKWMNQYDGEKALPESSGNRGDDPRHHHWSQWMNGIIGVKPAKSINVMQAARMIVAGRQKAEELQHKRRNFAKRVKIVAKRKGR